MLPAPVGTAAAARLRDPGPRRIMPAGYG